MILAIKLTQVRVPLTWAEYPVIPAILFVVGAIYEHKKRKTVGGVCFFFFFSSVFSGLLAETRSNKPARRTTARYDRQTGSRQLASGMR
jgi:hypothetical protein